MPAVGRAINTMMQPTPQVGGRLPGFGAPGSTTMPMYGGPGGVRMPQMGGPGGVPMPSVGSPLGGAGAAPVSQATQPQMAQPRMMEQQRMMAQYLRRPQVPEAY